MARLAELGRNCFRLALCIDSSARGTFRDGAFDRKAALFVLCELGCH
jgi:hypothetical protein